MISPEHDRLLSAYLTGEIEDSARTELEELLASDPAIAARLLELSAVDLLLAENGDRAAAAPAEAAKAPGETIRPPARPKFSSPLKVIEFPGRRSIARTLTPGSAAAKRRSRRRLGPVFAIAAALAFCAGGYWWFVQDRPIADLEAVTGQVRLFHGGKVSALVQAGDGIRSGDRLETAKGADCRFRFRGEATVIHLPALAALTVELSEKGGKQLRLLSGQIDAQVARQRAQPMTISTHLAVATVLGTRLSMAESAERTAIQVTSGEVRFTDVRRTAAVQVGHERLAVIGSDVPLQLVAADSVQSVADLMKPGDVLLGRRLLHDWDFEGNTRDEAGSLHTTEFGVSYVAGHRGKALDLSKSGGFTTDITALPERIELDFWTYLPPLPPILEKGVSKRTIICNSRSGYTDDGFRLMAFADASDPGSLLLEAGDGKRGTASFSRPGSLPPDQWSHAIIRIDRPAGRVSFIINGRDETRSGNGLHRDFGSLAPLTIGMMENGNYPLKGLLDELRVFSVSSP